MFFILFLKIHLQVKNYKESSNKFFLNINFKNCDEDL